MSAVAVGTVIGGRYKVLREIGRGGMGIVYLVEHVHTGEKLALKVLVAHAATDDDAVARFKREARASTKIQSEHVVRVTDADVAPELGGAPFMVMEFLDGVDLEKLLERDGPMKPEVLVRILGEVGRALGKAHRLGIVHRDLKPENLFLHRREDGVLTAKILDFGISKILAASEVGLETAGMTATGSVLGTPLFMSPEQAHGDNEKIGPSTDIWALGLVTMRLLTGESYWSAKNMAELMMHLVVKPIIPPSERWPGAPLMSPALDAWFLRSCNREQSARFGTVEEQIAALARALGVQTPASSQPPSTGAEISEHAAPSSPPGANASAPSDSKMSSTAPMQRLELARTLPAKIPTPSVMATSVVMESSTSPSAHPAVDAPSQEDMAALSRSTGATRPQRSRLGLAFGAIAVVTAAVAVQQFIAWSSSRPASITIDASLATDRASATAAAMGASPTTTVSAVASERVPLSSSASNAGASTPVASAIRKPTPHQTVPHSSAASPRATAPVSSGASPHGAASTELFNPQAP